MKDSTAPDRRTKPSPSSQVLESQKSPVTVSDAKNMKKLEQRVAYLTNELEEERKRADEKIVDLMCKVSHYEDSSKEVLELEQRNNELTRKLAEYEGANKPPQRPLFQLEQKQRGHFLFLGADSVAESIAEELGVKKEDIFIHQSGVIWVKSQKALDDTRIVREAREFLMSNGVRLEAFSCPAPNLSDTVILVKNLPLGMQKKELRQIFNKFGDLRKVIIPPEGAITALVAFRRNEEAKNAFSKLQPELQLRDHPLFIEWAPKDVFEEEEELGEGTCDDADPSRKKRKRDEGKNNEEMEERKIKKIKKEVIVIDVCDESNSEMDVVKSGKDVIEESSSTTPKCFLCEYQPSSVADCYMHIKKIHRTSLCKRRHTIECACGSLIYSIRTKNIHASTKCEGLVFNLRELLSQDRRKTFHREKCIACKVRPLNWVDYLHHLKGNHIPLFDKHGYEMQCACGLTIDSSVEDNFFMYHKMKECKSRVFKMIKRGSG